MLPNRVVQAAIATFAKFRAVLTVLLWSIWYQKSSAVRTLVINCSTSKCTYYLCAPHLLFISSLLESLSVMTEKCCMLIPCPLTNVVGVDRLLTPCPLTPSLDWRCLCRQDAARIIHVRYDPLKSQCHWWNRGLVWLLPLKGICTIGCCCQMIWTSSVPGSLMESGHHLWPCVCYR